MSAFEKYCTLCNQGPINGPDQWQAHLNGKNHKKKLWAKGSSMQSDLPDDKRSTKFVPSHTNVVDVDVPFVFDEDDDMEIVVDCLPIQPTVVKPTLPSDTDDFPALSASSNKPSTDSLTSKMSGMSVGRGRGWSKPRPEPQNPAPVQSWSRIAQSNNAAPSNTPQPGVSVSAEAERRPLTQSERSGNVRVIPQPQMNTNVLPGSNRPMAKNPKYNMARRIYNEFKSGKKTASQAFQEIATTLQWLIDSEDVVPETGSYAMKWIVNGMECEAGEGQRKKQAKEQASRKALARFRSLIENPEKESEDVASAPKERSTSQRVPNPPDEYKRLTMTKIDELIKKSSTRLSLPTRFAAIIITREEDQPASDGVVVAIGTGRRITKMNYSDAEEAYGYRMHDMQAPVLAKRAFQAYLYGQLSQAKRGDSYAYKYGENILQYDRDTCRYRLKDGVRVHLYLSHPPNGDAVAFVPDNWDEPETLSPEEMERDLNGILNPIPEDVIKGFGRLRIVSDPTRGFTSIIGDNNGVAFRGQEVVPNEASATEKVRIMSLSDKILKWNHLGIQGGLLTHFIEPIFLYSIQIGSGYHHGHMARALVTRVPLHVFSSMPEGYRNATDPYIGRPTKLTRLRNQPEGGIAFNWFLGTPDLEVINCDEGVIDIRADANGDAAECSRLCKVTMLQRFEARWTGVFTDGDVECSGLTKRIRSELGNRFKVTDYINLKAKAKAYQTAKRQIYSSILETQMGSWTRKENLQHFSLKSYDEN